MKSRASETVLQKAIEGFKQDRTATSISRELGIPVSTIKDWRRDWKAERGIPSNTQQSGLEIEESDTTKTVLCRSYTVRTLEAALEEAQVDLDVWEVERHLINKWDCAAFDNGFQTTELWQVKVWLRRKAKKPQETALENLLNRISEASPKQQKAPRKKLQKPHLLEICLFDHHFGKLCWEPEVGNNYDLKIAERIFRNAIEDLYEYASAFSIEKFLLPLGNDFLHVDNQENTTAAGTPQDTEGRLPKIIETGEAAMIAAIDFLLAIAPVEVVLVPGNHDPALTYSTARVLRAWYRNAPDVTVDVGPAKRKYVQYGTCLIGYTHGDKEKPASLPTIMATERPFDWANTTHREFHIGHRHVVRKFETLPVDTYDGVVVRTIPSLSGIDAWHYEKGYVGHRSAEAYLWSPTDGYKGHFSVNVREN